MKVYFDRKLIIKEYVSFLSPILWIPDFDIRWEDKEQIRNRSFVWNKYIIKSSMEDCDYFIYPKYFSLELYNELKEYVKLASAYWKKTIVFDYWEIDDYIDISNDILWFKRSTKKTNPENEYCLPPFPKDIYNEVNSVWVEENSTEISIWFCGYSKTLNIKYFLSNILHLITSLKVIKKILMKLGNTWLYNILVNAWIWNYYRWKTISQLKQMKIYKFNFIERKHALTKAESEKYRKEYLKNMSKSIFPLSIRGFWNYSVRHYEILSTWKIPLYIDTWAKLPFESKINYKDLFIIVPFFDIKNIENYINEYIKKNHNILQNKNEKIRYIYKNYFTMTAYYKKIIEILL